MIIFLFHAGTDVRINNIFKIWKVKTMKFFKIEVFKKITIFKSFQRNINVWNVYCVWVFCLCVGRCILYMYGAQSSQKKSLGLWNWVVMVGR